MSFYSNFSALSPSSKPLSPAQAAAWWPTLDSLAPPSPRTPGPRAALWHHPKLNRSGHATSSEMPSWGLALPHTSSLPSHPVAYPPRSPALWVASTHNATSSPYCLHLSGRNSASLKVTALISWVRFIPSDIYCQGT